MTIGSTQKPKNRNSFVFHRTLYNSYNTLPIKRQGQFMKAVLDYALDGIEPEGLSPVMMSLFTCFREGIDRTQARYDASVENGKKGGRQPKNNLEEPSGNLYVNDNGLSERPRELTEENYHNARTRIIAKLGDFYELHKSSIWAKELESVVCLFARSVAQGLLGASVLEKDISPEFIGGLCRTLRYYSAVHGREIENPMGYIYKSLENELTSKKDEPNGTPSLI